MDNPFCLYSTLAFTGTWSLIKAFWKCLCLVEVFSECLRDAACCHLGIIGHLLVSKKEGIPYGRKQIIAVLLSNVFSTWISKLRLLLCLYQILYFQLLYHQKNEGQCCTLCSLQLRERQGMSQWEPVLCQFQLLVELLSLRYTGFTHSKALLSTSNSSQFKHRLLRKEVCSLHLFPCQHLCQRGCTRNEITLIKMTWF